MTTVYEKVREFKSKYPRTIAWRLKQHSKVIQMHLNPGEVVKFAFTGQKTPYYYDIFSTVIVVITNKRILLGQDRLVFGYFYTAITPDLFNDIELKMALLWGGVYIDTVKELVVLNKIDGRALPDIETSVTEFMMEEKKKYGLQN